ncbi:MAG: hypothetical protein DMG67_14320 [Acidobacteria bacterium]|nr:MAG: hypothetical protein DMG67_14320 [Acidobacteriota bacterium]
MNEVTKGRAGISRCTKTSGQKLAGREVRISGGGIGRNWSAIFRRKALGQGSHLISNWGGVITRERSALGEEGFVGKGASLVVSNIQHQSVRSERNGVASL